MGRSVTPRRARTTCATNTCRVDVGETSHIAPAVPYISNALRRRRCGLPRQRPGACEHKHAREALIVRHRGRGSFVHSRPGVDRPQAVTNLILGYKAEIKVITVQTVPAPAHIVGPLGIERGTPVTRLVRLEMIDAAPLAVVVNYMLPSLGKRIRPRDLTRISLLEFLRDRLGMRLGTIHQSLEARLPDIETTGLLGPDLNKPVLALRLVVTDVAGTPVEVSDAFYRADRYRYEVKTQLPPARRQPTVRETRSRRGGRTVLQP